MPKPQVTAAPTRAVIYDRVSQDRRKGRSVDDQHTENTAACTEHGWTIIDEYRDKVSASRFATKPREEWPKVVAALADGGFDVLVLWESSRGDRDLEPWAALLSACRRYNVLIHITSHHRTYDVRRARDWRSLAEDGVDSHYESEKTSERIRRDVRSRAAMGSPHGRFTYGYRREYELTTGGHKRFVRQVLDEETAPIVKEIFRRVADREGTGTIATSLTRRNLATPRPDPKKPQPQPWRSSSVRGIALNYAYLGELRLNPSGDDTEPVIVRDAWPALIDHDLFYRARAVLTAPNRPPGPNPAAKHILSGIARCGVCESVLYYSGGGKSGNPIYYCYDRNCVGRNAAALEDYALPRAIAIIEAQDLTTDDGEDPDLDAADEDYRALRDRLDGFTDAAADGKISEARLSRIEARLGPQIAAAEAKLTRLRARSKLRERDFDGPVADVFDDPELLPLQRDLLRGAVDICVYPTGAGRKKFDPSKVEINPL